MSTLSRRDFLKDAAASAVGIAAVTMLNGCSSTTSTSATLMPTEDIHTTGTTNTAGPSSCNIVVSNPNTQIAEAEFTTGNMSLTKMFEPCKIGKLTIKNRFIKSGAGSGNLSPDVKTPPATTLNYYEAIAKGGVGLVIMESSLIEKNGFSFFSMLFFDDSAIELHKAFADIVHKHDVPIFAQVLNEDPYSSDPAVCVSSSTQNFPSANDWNSPKPRMLTTDEVKQKIQTFIDAAVRYQKAGYDGIEINCAASHLLGTFISRFFNNERTDQYSGDNIENRTRIVCEIIQGIHEKCGADFPVSVLMNGVEINALELGNNEACTSLEEAPEIAKAFEKAGAAYLHVRAQPFGDHAAGFFTDRMYIGEPGHNSYGAIMDWSKGALPEFTGQYGGAAGFIEIAANIKKSVSIPVGVVGCEDPSWIPDLLEKALEDGKIDFIIMNRPLMVDPELPNKLKDGRRDEIAPCNHCLTCYAVPKTLCRVNACLNVAGDETMPEGYDVTPATTKKKVMVVGGGPAGMEAARIAAKRGHEVTLFEKKDDLGGLLPLAVLVKDGHERVQDFINYLKRQLEVNNVLVKTGVDVTKELVESEKPDAVVVAVGGNFTTPEYKGGDKSIVHNMSEYKDYTSKNIISVGQNVVVLGGQMQGFQLAAHFARNGCNVTVVESGDETFLGIMISSTIRASLLTWMRAKAVKFHTSATCQEITDNSVIIMTKVGTTVTIPADTVIISAPLALNTQLFTDLNGVVKEVYAVGDCAAPGAIINAISKANLTARAI
jgi:2,4-dienoyl-CoA reductase-like NADH-dependent reductase (Old Yellow Enzyme family)/thioredoxin reductase